jgi:hypothetical protein
VGQVLIIIGLTESEDTHRMLVAHK